MNHMREDATVLTNPRFNSGEMSAEAQEATKSAVENVKATLDELNDSYKELTTLCQQKRDLFIVCVKFHMTTRQVKMGGGRGMEGVDWWVWLELLIVRQLQVIHGLSDCTMLCVVTCSCVWTVDYKCGYM